MKHRKGKRKEQKKDPILQAHIREKKARSRDITLHLPCAHCGGALAVKIEPWEPLSNRLRGELWMVVYREPDPITLLAEDPFVRWKTPPLPEERRAVATFPCPYCQQLNHGQLGGIVLQVTKDGEPPPPGVPIGRTS
jgi:hypothetical protein